MKSFKAEIQIIGINPYVLVPAGVLKMVFAEAGKDKGAIPVKISLDGHSFIQTLVKYSGKWRLYLNTPMRQAAGKDVGDTIEVKIEFDPVERANPVHPKLQKALLKNVKAKEVFDSLAPSRRKEIIRYINNLKTEDSVNKNIEKAILNLLALSPK